ncbi:MAG: hypothetical protein NXH75_06185 [Halobacteriovoraceae bacterium]|nr:hypothetical protein [Halobacteriovoraceae bacterium]
MTRYYLKWKNELEKSIPNTWTLTIIFTTFLLCLYRVVFKLNMKPSGTWEGASSLYGLLFEFNLLPFGVLESSVVFNSYRIAFLLSFLSWLFLKKYRTTLIFLSFAFFTLACSHHIENIPRASSHTGNILSITLFFLFLGHKFNFTDISKLSLSEFQRGHSTSYLLPFSIRLALFLIYSISGFYKLYRSGFSWVSSENIQTYLHYFGRLAQKENLLSLAMDSPTLAMMMGSFVLALEVFAVIGVFTERLGMIVGSLFIFFHLGVTYYFGWSFFSHLSLLLIVASPLTLIWITPSKSLPAP